MQAFVVDPPQDEGNRSFRIVLRGPQEPLRGADELVGRPDRFETQETVLKAFSVSSFAEAISGPRENDSNGEALAQDRPHRLRPGSTCPNDV